MTPQASSQLPPSTEVTPPVATSPKPVTTAPVVVGPTVLEPKGPSTVQVPPPAAIKPEPATSKAAVMASTPKVQVAAPDVAAPVVAQAPVAVSKPIATLPVKKPTVPTAVTSAPIPPAAVAAKSKSSKKKKNPPLVTMATAATATSGGPGTQGENTGRWTAEEHRLFLQGLEQHGKGWKKIASLIKSRTVVQIRTHAQKYFQKLSKARQNGEEGEISMEGRGGPASVTSGGLTGTGIPTGKRRRQTTGTKRKAISSVVVSATREGKNIAAAQAAAGVAGALPPLPAVAPALAPFVVPPPQPSANSSSNIPVSTYHGAISGPALEDSLFRFLTPAPVHAGNDTVQVNEVARQAGANPITLPAENPSSIMHASGGEVSPTGVTDVAIFPSWTDAKDMPSWYAKGADVDCLLDVADTLDWLTDTGDFHETYDPPAQIPTLQPTSCPAPTSITDDLPMLKAPSMTTLTADSLSGEDVVPPLPSLFENTEPSSKRQRTSSTHLDDMDDHLDVFDTPMEEHAFVTALLENTGESSGSLALLS